MAQFHWPQLVFARQHDAAVISRALRRGRLQRLARGVYSGDTATPAPVLVRRYLWALAADAFPGAVVTGPAALRVDPAEGGDIHLIHARRRPLALPGVTLVPVTGSGPQPDDTPLAENVWLSSPSRVLLTFFSQPAAAQDLARLYAWWQRQTLDGRTLLAGLASRAQALNLAGGLAGASQFLRYGVASHPATTHEKGAAPALSVTAQLLATDVIAHGGAAQSELTARLGMAKSTVSAGLQELMQQRLLVAGPPTRGRGGSLYSLSREAGWVLGADIGNTQAMFIARSLEGKQLALRQFTNYSSTQLVMAAAEAISALRQALSAFGPLLAIAIALPKPVHPDMQMSGRDGPSQAGLTPDAILARLALPASVQPIIENNVNCAVVSEVREGIGKGLQDVVFLQIGERIGGGVIAAGQLIHGARGGAGEIADMPFPWSVNERPGDLLLERHLAQRGFMERLNARRGDGQSAVRSLEALLERAAHGEPAAMRAVAEYGEQIGFLALGLVAILDPAMIILGGSVGANRLIVAAVRQTVSSMSPYTAVAASQFGAQATAEGAVRLALEAAQRKLLGRAVRTL